MSQYGFTDKTESEKRVGGFMEPGIRESLEITKLELEHGEPGTNPFLLVEATDDDGKTVHKRYYEPAMGGFITSQQILEKEIKKFNGVIANIARKFLGHNYQATGNSYQEVVTKVITDIGDRYRGVKLRGKVILNQKDFPSLPGYAPIFERMDEVAADKSELVIGINDKVIPSEQHPQSGTGTPLSGNTSNMAAPWTQQPPTE